MSDFEDFARQFQVDPVTHRPVEQRSIFQRVGDMWETLKRFFWGFVILLIGFGILSSFLQSWERTQYRRDLLEKDYLIEVRNGRERAVKQ